MLKAYKDYKNWWVNVRGDEASFIVHWNNLTNYQLFEILEEWSTESETPKGN